MISTVCLAHEDPQHPHLASLPRDLSCDSGQFPSALCIPRRSCVKSPKGPSPGKSQASWKTELTKEVWVAIKVWGGGRMGAIPGEGVSSPSSGGSAYSWQPLEIPRLKLAPSWLKPKPGVTKVEHEGEEKPSPRPLGRVGRVTNRTRCDLQRGRGSFRAEIGCLCSSQVGTAEPHPCPIPPLPSPGSVPDAAP